MLVKEKTGVEHEVAEFRQRVLDRVLLLCFAALLTGLATTFNDAYAKREYLFQLALLPGAICVGWAALWTKAPTRLRHLALVIGVITASCGVAFKTGFLTPNAFSAHLMLVVLTALVIGRRAAWNVLALVVALWVAIAARFVAGAAVPAADTFDPHLVENWVRVLSVFTAVAVTCVAAATYLVDKMIGTVRRAEALHHALTLESTKRIAALEEQQRLEEHLRQSRKLEALGTMAGGVAHDFNNLLMVILSHVELAKQSPLPVAARESLAEIHNAGQRASALTHQLLAFGRSQVATRGPVKIDQVVGDTLRMLRRLLPSSIDLEVRTGAKDSTVWSDAVELSQVVMNLCVNARDAMPEGGLLTVSTSQEQQTPPEGGPQQTYACLRIQDNGSGMDATTIERAFEPFFTTKEPGAGTGLGLSTVHGIVQQLGGFARIHSTPALGTTVSIWMPLSGAAETQAVQPQIAEWRGHETLLVVDDDRGVREVNAAFLRQAGYQVITCDNGKDAWELYRQRSRDIALIVSDAIMPHMGGRELHRRITHEFGEVPFLVCSGYTDEAFAADFFTHPLRAFIGKPYLPSTLQKQVRSLLDAAKTAPVRDEAPKLLPAALRVKASV